VTRRLPVLRRLPVDALRTRSRGRRFVAVVIAFKSARREPDVQSLAAGHGRVGQVRVRVRNREDRRAVSTPDAVRTAVGRPGPATGAGIRLVTRAIERNRQRPRRWPRRREAAAGGSTPQRGRPPSLRKRTSAPIGWSRPPKHGSQRGGVTRRHLHEDALPGWYGQHRHRGDVRPGLDPRQRPGDLEGRFPAAASHARRPGGPLPSADSQARTSVRCEARGEARVTDVQAIARSSSGEGRGTRTGRAASTTSSVAGHRPQAAGRATPGQERPWGRDVVGVQARDDLGRIDVRAMTWWPVKARTAWTGPSGAVDDLRPAVGCGKATGRGIFEELAAARLGRPSTLARTGVAPISPDAVTGDAGVPRAQPRAMPDGRAARASPRGRPFGSPHRPGTDVAASSTTNRRCRPRPSGSRPRARPGFGGRSSLVEKQHGSHRRPHLPSRPRIRYPPARVPAGSGRSHSRRSGRRRQAR